MVVVKSNNNYAKLTLNEASLVSYDKKEKINITKLIRNISITESLHNVFIHGYIEIEDENDLYEQFIKTCREYVFISWKSHEDNTLRSYYFRIDSIPEILRVREGIIDGFKIKFTHEDYFKLIEGRYNKSYIEKTQKEILEDIFKEKKISNYEINTTNETYTLYNFQNNCFGFIDDVVRYKGSVPYVLYQKDAVLRYETWKDIFSQNEAKILNVETSKKDSDTMEMMISNVIKKDIIDNSEIQITGMNGNVLFEHDIWNNEFTLTDNNITDFFNTFKGQTIHEKFKVSELKNNVVRNNNSKFIEDYIVTNFINARLNYGNSDLFVGDLCVIKIMRNSDTKEYSKYSGVWSIYEIEHFIDENFRYTQNIILVKLSFFKNN